MGTTPPAQTFLVPGGSASTGAGFVIDTTRGWAYGTAITVACTTGVADDDTGAPGANACIIDIGCA